MINPKNTKYIFSLDLNNLNQELKMKEAAYSKEKKQAKKVYP